MTSFPYPSLEAVVEGDSLWGLEVSRKRAALFDVCDERNPLWLVQAAEYFHDVGEHKNALRYAERAMAASESKGRVHARALSLQCLSCLLFANGPMATRAARSLARLADESSDPYVGAFESLTWGMYRDKNGNFAESGPPDGDDTYSLHLYQEAARTFLSLGEVDLAIRAHVEYAHCLSSFGSYLSAIETVVEALRLAKAHDRWAWIGRILIAGGMAATDQGYRQGVEKALRDGIAWCEYMGDLWGRLDGFVALGRLLAYEMPGGDPVLAEEPDRYFRASGEVAETLGLSWMLGGIDNTRAWLFRKAGDLDRSRRLLGEDLEEKGPRERLASESTMVTERIIDDIQRNHAARLHDGVEDSMDAFFVFDALRNEDGAARDYVSRYANRAAIRILGRDPAHVCLYSEAQQVPHLGGLGPAIIGAVERRETFEDVQVVGPDGEEQWFQRRVVPSGDGAVVTLRDVTAEKRLESALRHSANSAERSERAKSEFLANMSHEIRTPLNGVLGLARMLAETDLDEIQRSYVDDIVVSGDILLDLIGDILDASKIESRDMRLTPTPVSLANLVTAIVKLFRGQAEEKGTTLTCRIDPRVPATVQADGVRLRQILANLVGNAIKFTRDGEVEVRVSTENALVVFEVRDTGVGIPAERVTAIFDRYQQAGAPSYGGTGLGLTISKALAELMGGDIRVVSEVGRGSSFFVRLPLREAERIADKPAAESPVRFDGRRILLVDDNRVNILVSSHTLKKLGCDVTYAENGQKALEALASEHFDLVLMDVRMPIMDGLEATRELRRREGERRTPVVALTAGALRQEQQECFEAGMDDFATKPFTADSIHEVLARWLLKAMR
ncbi:MAG: ATP-binding protein [Fimbriimonas sp.]